MLKYLIIPLSDNAVSFCHYNRKSTDSGLIPLEILREAILWGMKENLTIQFLYPDRKLNEEYLDLIDSIDHATIVSSMCRDSDTVRNADVIVFDSWAEVSKWQFNEFNNKTCYVIRTGMAGFVSNRQSLINIIPKVNRLVVIITDIDSLSQPDVEAYKKILDDLVPVIAMEYERGHAVQFNLLTDRLYLDKMNNCNAGCESVTLAPDGSFYICPAFYSSGWENEGNIHSGLTIRNNPLYRLDHAPVCRACDAYQCRRCVWLNRKRTLEVNTPGHIQCVVSHIERNASRALLAELRKSGEFRPGFIIPEIDYTDPFEKITR